MSGVNDAALGAHDIGSFGGFTIVFNNIVGPAIVTLPWLFQQAGWIPCVACILAVFVLSSLSGSMLAEGVARIPGNSLFDRRIEFATAVKYYFGRKWYIAFQWIYYISLQIMLMVYIVACAQTLDEFMILLFKRSWTLQYSPTVELVHSVSEKLIDQGTPIFGNVSDFNVSLGYIVCAAIFVPLCFFNLDSGMWFQYVSCGLFLFAQIEFFFQCFLFESLDISAIPAFAPNQTQVVGTIFFAFCYSYAVPSYLSERKRDSRLTVNQTLWYANAGAATIFMTMAFLGGWAYPKLGTSDILTIFVSKLSPMVTQVCGYIYSVFNIGAGVPLGAVNIRYNLYVERVFGRKGSFAATIIPPWILSMFFCNGAMFSELINWSSVLLNGITFFIIPICVYIKSWGIYEKREATDNPTDQNLEDSLLESQTPEPITRMSMIVSRMSTVASREVDSSIEMNSLERPVQPDQVERGWFGFGKERVYTGLPDTQIQGSCKALPPWLERIIHPRKFAILLIAITICMTLSTIFLDFYYLLVLGVDIVDN